MPYIVKKLKTFRLTESSLELLRRAKDCNVNISTFVREAINDKFERDFPKWIEEQKKIENQCPF